MKRDVWIFLMALVLTAGLGSCSDDKIDSQNDNTGDPEINGTTYVGLALRVPQAATLRDDSQDFNYIGAYTGYMGIDKLDLYLYTADGNTQLMATSFVTLGTDFTMSVKNGQQYVELASPIKTNPGQVLAVVILNSQFPLMPATQPISTFQASTLRNIQRPDANTIIGDAYRSETLVASSIPIATISNTNYIISPTDGVTMMYEETINMDGMSAIPFTIQDNVSKADVQTGRMNIISVDVTKVVSKAIVTSTAGTTIDNTASGGTIKGTVSNLTYSVAQGENRANAWRQFTTDASGNVWTMTYSYNWVPGPAVSYTSQASTYYEYLDLLVTNRAINPLTVAVTPSLGAMPGVYLMPVTHQYGPTPASSGYRKGNTAYALIRATFTPDPSVIWANGAFGGALNASDPNGAGTFYYGFTDQVIYANLTDAENAASTPTINNQYVQTYVGGKMLYYAWLNPDNASNPAQWVNSPVIRNNIYHINIASFSGLGTNWNPLVPPDVTNPDPEPGGSEPPTSVDPTDPIGKNETYMQITVNIIPWNVHSYGKTL